MRAVPVAAVLLMLLVFASYGVSQPVDQASAPATLERPLRLFVDCLHAFCESDYLRQEIEFVDYVRDVRDADVYIAAAGEETGRGTLVTLHFRGRGALASLADTLRFFAPSEASRDEGRRTLVRLMRSGLVRYLAHSGAFEHISISYVEPGTGARPPTVRERRDPWRGYVVRLHAGAAASAEQQFHSLLADGGLTINRITAAVKVRGSFRGDVSRQFFRIDEETSYADTRSNYSASTLIVWSLTDHLSLGAVGSLRHATFANAAVEGNLGAAVEWSLYPYSEAARRQVTLLYDLGLTSVRYEEETIFFLTHETMPSHSFTAGVDYQQMWGSVSAFLMARQRPFGPVTLDFDALASIRLVRGLALDFSGGVTLVREQRHLRRGGASPEQVLLRRTELATGYRFYSTMGLSYTFGSPYAGAVNPRMGR